MKQRDCEAFLDAWLSTEGVGGVRRRGEGTQGSRQLDLIAKEGVRRPIGGESSRVAQIPRFSRTFYSNSKFLHARVLTVITS